MTIIEFLDKYAIAIIIVMIILALIFICIGHVHREKIQLAMKRDFVKLPGTTIDWWSVSHLVFFGIIGFIWPNYHVTACIGGALFEVFEDMLSSDKTTQLDDCMTPDKDTKFMCKFSINDDYWYAKWDDVFANLLGYCIGSAVRTTCYPTKIKDIQE